MPWITKNSGSATIQTRDEPYLTADMVKKLRDEYIPPVIFKNSRDSIFSTSNIPKLCVI